MVLQEKLKRRLSQAARKMSEREEYVPPMTQEGSMFGRKVSFKIPANGPEPPPTPEEQDFDTRHSFIKPAETSNIELDALRKPSLCDPYLEAAVDAEMADDSRELQQWYTRTHRARVKEKLLLGHALKDKDLVVQSQIKTIEQKEEDYDKVLKEPKDQQGLLNDQRLVNFDLKKKFDTASTIIADQANSLEAVRSKGVEDEAKLKEAQEQLQSKNEKLNTAKTEVDDQNKRIETLNKEVRGFRSTLGRRNVTINELKRELADERNRVVQKMDELQEAKTNFADALRGYEAENAKEREGVEHRRKRKLSDFLHQMVGSGSSNNDDGRKDGPSVKRGKTR